MKRIPTPGGPAAAATADTYWHGYYPPALVAEIEAVRRAASLESTGVRLHVDVYAQADAAAPVLILNHGGGGYSGMFAGMALACHRRGYTVVVPDQKGQGLSGGARGDFTLGEAVRNIVDVAHWARRTFAGTLYMAGGSLGGGLSYAAAAELVLQGQPPAALFCLNLYDFGDPRQAIAFTRFAALARAPGLASAARWSMRVLARLAPRLRLPYRPLAHFRHMLDRRDEASGFYAKWQADPHTLTTVTARYLASMFDTPAAIRFEDNRALAVLVVNQRRDRMIAPAWTRASFARLGGTCRYAEIDWGHFSLQPAFTDTLARLGDDWFRQHGAEAAPASAA